MKGAFEDKEYIYGYFDGNEFYRFDDIKCITLNCIYSKETKLVYKI